jgi:hypothetical protein
MGYLNSLSDRATSTTNTLNLYANGTTGNDTNDGLTILTPKKTLPGVWNLIPDYVKHQVIVNLSGTFIISTGTTLASKNIIYDGSKGSITLDGGSNFVTIAGPFVASSGDTLNLSVLGEVWAPDMYSGYFVKINDGAAINNYRMIVSSTIDTISFSRALSASPGTPSFSIVRPETTIVPNSGYQYIQISSIGNKIVSGVNLQRLYFDGNMPLNLYGNNIYNICGCIFNTYFTGYGSIFVYDTSNVIFQTFGGASLIPTQFKCGAGFLQTDGGLFAYGNNTIGVYDSYLRKLNLLNSNEYISRVSYGTRINGQTTLRNMRGSGNDVNPFYKFAISGGTGYADTIFENAAGPALLAYNSELSIGPGVIFKNSTHGIESIRSFIRLDGAVEGTGNTGAGVYAHSGSTIYIKNGEPPTLTGALDGGCDLSFDGSSQASTWGIIDGGTSAVSATELSMCKEVT